MTAFSESRPGADGHHLLPPPSHIPPALGFRRDVGHEAVLQHPDRVALGELLRHTDITSAGPRAALVIVTEKSRLAQKYGDFAHRLGLLDAGCAVAQICAVCDALGIGVDVASAWTEKVTELLEVDVHNEFVSAVMTLHDAGGR